MTLFLEKNSFLPELMIKWLSEELRETAVYNTILATIAVFDFSTLSVMSVIGVILSVALSIGLAYLSWIVVEQKFSGWLRKKLLH